MSRRFCMNEEIEYAEMLEIPVSTVNVVRKNQRRRKQKSAEELSAFQPDEQTESIDVPSPLKDSVIAQVNDRLEETPLNDAQTPNEALLMEGENSQGTLNLDPISDRIDTVRLYSEEESTAFFDRALHANDYTQNQENDRGRYEMKSKPAKALRLALGIEFAAACALCGAIFLTNVFMPNSAINTFFRAIGSPAEAAQTDTRQYSDFVLSPVISSSSDAELTLSPTGILSFTDACCVYPTADGTVKEVLQAADGTYSVKIAHSDSFTGVISGLDYVYYETGDAVKSNVPVGYSEGETEVQVTMYSSGTLLNCFQLTEENCLAWVNTSTQS